MSKVPQWIKNVETGHVWLLENEEHLEHTLKQMRTEFGHEDEPLYEKVGAPKSAEVEMPAGAKTESHSSKSK